MEIIAHFAARLLEPINRFRAKNDVRYYLNAVMVEPSKKGGVNIVATDGHRMMAARDPDGHVDKQRLFRLARPLVSASKKNGAGRIYLYESLAVVVNNKMEEDGPLEDPLKPSLDTTIGKIEWVDGKFPDWAYLLRDIHNLSCRDQGSWFSINTEYLASISGAFDAMSDPRGRYNGAQVIPPETPNDCICFLPGNSSLEAICMIMPMRCSDKPEASIGWIPESEKAKK